MRMECHSGYEEEKSAGSPVKGVQINERPCASLLQLAQGDTPESVQIEYDILYHTPGTYTRGKMREGRIAGSYGIVT